MPFKGFDNAPSITGVEEFISITMTGEQDELVIDAGSQNTAPTVATYFNPRYTIQIEGISSGVSVPETFEAYSTTWVRTGQNLTRSVGDVVRVSVSGVYNPASTLGT